MRRILALVTATVLAAGGLAACSKPEEEARAVLDDFLAGWTTGELAEVTFLDPLGAAVPAATVAEQLAEISGDLVEQPPELAVESLTVSDDLATATVAVDWPLPGGANWPYQTIVRLSEGGNGWQVIWTPAVVHPELVAGDELKLRRALAPRGAILDGAGGPLVAARPVRDIGAWPSRIENVDAFVTGLDDALASIGLALDETMAGLPDRIADAREDDQFVYVVTLRADDYAQIATALQDLGGVMVQDEYELPLAPSRTFARALLGTVGPVTAEIMDANPGVYEASDRAGQGGLSGAYEEQLRGVPGQTVSLDRDDIELARVEPVPGTDLPTTIDSGVQAAAEAALAATPQRAALVAVRVSDGAILAVANTRGDEAETVNIALTGQVAPGSTFKMVTGYGLLDTGAVTLDGAVACPAELTVGGFTIGNAFSGDRGQIPFRQAMAISCNTTFAGLAPELGDGGLAAAGSALGLGGDWTIGIDAFTGSVPTGGSDLDRAQVAFGQGGTAVSPLAMAVATASVARGAWLPPSLVVAPEPESAEPVALDSSAVADLQASLRAVVTDGTASALGGVPGGDVHGKTGTAETGEDGVEHAWFVGWQDDLAVAIFVEGGGSGSGTAVPLADAFLRTV